MRKRQTDTEPRSTLAAGYQSIPALKPPKTWAEIRAIVGGQRAERERKQVEQEGQAEPEARALENLRDPDASRRR